MIKIIDLHIYPNKVYYFQEESYATIVDVLDNEDIPHDGILEDICTDESYGGYTIEFGSAIVVIAKSDLIHEITHELFHVVEKVMEYVGIKHCDESSEAFAYLLTYLTKEVCESKQ